MWIMIKRKQDIQQIAKDTGNKIQYNFRSNLYLCLHEKTWMLFSYCCYIIIFLYDGYYCIIILKHPCALNQENPYLPLERLTTYSTSVY